MGVGDQTGTNTQYGERLYLQVGRLTGDRQIISFISVQIKLLEYKVFMFIHTFTCISMSKCMLKQTMCVVFFVKATTIKE